MEKKQKFRFDIILLGIALLSAFLNTYNIWQNRYANAYYTAAVTSMLQSFHNFLFASFDPGGFVTVDKPPVTFWVQTLFAKVFGVHGWSVILPQALAGIGSVVLIYYLVKPSFGKTAARLSSLVMACTPIAVAVSRTNNIDSMLVFTLLLATWMLFKAVRNRKTAWLLGAFAMIGLGFNMKMLQAYMVLPAFYLFCLLAFKCDWKKKLATLTAATIVLVVVSASWTLMVQLVPEENRPYIGGSRTNSALELAFGYNGLSRLTGMNQGGPGFGAPTEQTTANPPQMQQIPQNGSSLPRPDEDWRQGEMPNRGGNESPGARNGMFGTGRPGLLRLFQTELAGQASWLLPFIAFASIGLLAGMRRNKTRTDKENETLFWLAWLLPVAGFFSVAGFFHQYYLIMLAPPIAVLAGAGWVELRSMYQLHAGRRMWLLPLSVLATIAFELQVLRPFQQQIGAGWSISIGVVGAGLILLLFFAAHKPRISSVAAKASMLILLAAPLYWATTPLVFEENSTLPQAGPSQRSGFMQGGPSQASGFPQFQTQNDATNNETPAGYPSPAQMPQNGREDGVNDKLLDFVTRNNTGETYLFATTSAGSAQQYIIETGQAVMAMGGFSGSDPILTSEKLEKLVESKQVKYFLIPSGSGFGSRGGDNTILEWIRTHGTEVPAAEWQASTAQNASPDFAHGNTLYEIKTTD